MKALPPRVETWHDSDKAEGVRFKLKPPDHYIRTHMAVAHEVKLSKSGKDDPVFNYGGHVMDLVGIVLIDIEGLEGWVPERKTLDLDGREYSQLTYQCLETIPARLFDEIRVYVNAITMLTPDEFNAIKNMSGSPQIQGTTDAESVAETPTNVPPESV